jgi:predicted HicB family RNase H-like nuclease
MSQATPLPEAIAQPIREMTPSVDDSRSQSALKTAADKYRQASDWVAFYRDVLGVDGVIRKLFSQPEDRVAFERGPEYLQIQQMLAKLRERKDELSEESEPTRVITVRLPKSVHEALKAEAHFRQTSMNKLCISKLLQIIDNELVPSD